MYCKILTIVSDQRLFNASAWIHGQDIVSLLLLMTRLRMITPPPVLLGAQLYDAPQQTLCIPKFEFNTHPCHEILTIPVNEPYHVGYVPVARKLLQEMVFLDLFACLKPVLCCTPTLLIVLVRISDSGT